MPQLYLQKQQYQPDSDEYRAAYDWWQRLRPCDKEQILFQESLLYVKEIQAPVLIDLYRKHSPTLR